MSDPHDLPEDPEPTESGYTVHDGVIHMPASLYREFRGLVGSLHEHTEAVTELVDQLRESNTLSRSWGARVDNWTEWMGGSWLFQAAVWVFVARGALGLDIQTILDVWQSARVGGVP